MVVKMSIDSAKNACKDTQHKILKALLTDYTHAKLTWAILDLQSLGDIEQTMQENEFILRLSHLA